MPWIRGDELKGKDLVLDEYFENGDDRFVDRLRECHKDQYLAGLAGRVLKDPRPWTRQMLLRYFERPFDVFGHNVFVKRVYKDAEAKGDVEILARCLVQFDRSLRKDIKTTSHWDWESRTRTIREELVAPADAMLPPRQPETPMGMPKTGKRRTSVGWGGHEHIFPDPGRLFSLPTRRYMRRRVWRWFRRLGFRDLTEYRSAILIALRLYPNDTVTAGHELLDSWGLVHALFAESDVLQRGRESVTVAAGKSLDQLRPAPAFAAAWTDPAAAPDLIDLMATAPCDIVGTWAHELLKEHHADVLQALPLEQVQTLLASDLRRARLVGLDLLRNGPHLARLPVRDWLQLFMSEDPEIVGAVVELFPEHVHADRLSHEDAVALLGHSSAAVVDLALAIGEAMDWQGQEELLLKLASADCEVRDGDLCEFALRKLDLTGDRYDRELAVPFFDSLAAGVRAQAWEWLEGNGQAQRDAPLWAKLFETPYDDLRQELVPALERFHASAEALGEQRNTLWSSVLLNVQRGSRTKRRALRQLGDEIVAHPDAVEQLLPIMAVAVRSIRDPERESGLHAVLTVFARRPELRAPIAAALPELELPEEPPCW